ncbi:helix-turn-helix domain-containing protein [Actinacidiphila sp. ITFR-21]|uniref:helix-turn-helix domain-containing protein n=1 Tax=Actinacidiphila sp. ITFR-21 TaxID=3075199 RepID=UPI00288AED84|nr:helix-turn-helix domain-containing protein [Streptomyces sp. ITFR-21]WNI17372.1 helix-turn-helix domain-containing protein [Streptomyces sp. ITFR-21]
MSAARKGYVVGQWEPLAVRIPLDMRRFVTQLRRMKDRSGLTVPGLAAKTAQSAETWERALAGQQLPPLDAVEVLAQASGADYDRVRALWRLAETAGERGRGRPVPYPDPLDPLSAEDGLPGRRRRMLLLASAGILAAAALAAVLLTAGTSTGRSPAEKAGPTPSGPVASQDAPGRPSGAQAAPGSGGTSAVPVRSAPAPAGSATDTPATPGGRPSVIATTPPARSGTAPGTDPAGPGAVTTTPPANATPSGGGTPSAEPSPSATTPPPTTPAPTPTPTRQCLLNLLGICIG